MSRPCIAHETSERRMHSAKCTRETAAACRPHSHLPWPSAPESWKDQPSIGLEAALKQCCGKQKQTRFSSTVVAAVAVAATAAVVVVLLVVGGAVVVVIMNRTSAGSIWTISMSARQRRGSSSVFCFAEMFNIMDRSLGFSPDSKEQWMNFATRFGVERLGLRVHGILWQAVNITSYGHGFFVS